MKEENFLGAHRISPHFFTKIFNLAEANRIIKTVLVQEDFFSLKRMEPLRVVQQESFCSLQKMRI